MGACSSVSNRAAGLFAKWLTSCCYPLVIATSSIKYQQPHHRLYKCPHRQHELFNTDYIIRNNRKRVRIKQQLSVKHIFECRGGDMDDMYSHPQTRADVVSAAATADHMIDHEGRINVNVHNSYSSPHTESSNNNAVNVIHTSSSTMSNNQLNGLQIIGSSQQDDTSDDISTNQILQQTKPSSPPNQHEQQAQQRQRLMVEFDTQAMGNSDRFGNSIRSRIRSRIVNVNDWDRTMGQQRRGSVLSISLDLSPNNGSGTGDAIYQNVVSTQTATTTPSSNNNETNGNTNNLSTLTIHTILTTYTILKQSALLLPPLLLSRRALNSTRNAIVDYFRGRVFRQTFTRMERAYLRYYEFPAAIRAVARLASQIGILLCLSVAVRCWMFMILAGDVVGPSVLGMDIRQNFGMVGTSSSGGGVIGLGSSRSASEGIFSNVWNVGLPCHQRGRGMAWLCGLIWIGAAVGTGHACTVALSVWGGPLRLQATAVQAEKPKQLILRAIHHPIKWVRELEEWKHLPDLQPRVSRKDGARRRRGGGRRVLDLDPLLFPATWLPLRWVQIFAVAKAFSTDPQNYRWCSPENDRIVIPKLMKQYLIQLALGDEWQRVFLGEKRVGLGIIVVLSYFVALVWMVFTAFTLDGGSAAMLIPSVLAAIISGVINFMVFWNRLGTRSQKKALEAIGWA
jgi:tryptophan-rich sensory protein